MTRLYESLDESVLNSLPSKRLSTSTSTSQPIPFLAQFFRRRAKKTVKWTSTIRKTKVKPVVYIVLTDGEPTDDPKEVILTFARALQLDQWPERQVGIQFVQVGDSSYAARALREMDDALKSVCGRVSSCMFKVFAPGATDRGTQDMVDYTLYDPSAVHDDPEEDVSIKGHLMKILLGAINERVDMRASGDVKVKSMNRRKSNLPQGFSAPPNYHEATSSWHY